MKIWVSRDRDTDVDLWRLKPKWDEEQQLWLPEKRGDYENNYIHVIDHLHFGEITGIFVKEGEALHLDVQTVIMERLTGEVES